MAESMTQMESQIDTHNRYDTTGPQLHRKLPRVEIEIRRGRARSRIRPVTSPVFLIGTASDCDMVLGSPQFPAVHAYLFVTNRDVSIRCLGAPPQLTVGGQPVQASRLNDGDLIRTGPYEFRVGIQWPPGVEPGRRELRQPAESTVPVESGSSDGLVEAERLLNDIRGAMYPGATGLRVYVDPDSAAQPMPPPLSGVARRAIG